MRFFAAVFAGLILGVFPTSSIVDQSIHAQNQEVRFFCGTREGKLATILRNETGKNVPLILWVSGYFSSSGWTLRRRCERVSENFQIAYENGTLQYLTTEIMNGYPVICATRQYMGSCEKFLFTVPSYEEPEKIIERLTSVCVPPTRAEVLNCFTKLNILDYRIPFSRQRLKKDNLSKPMDITYFSTHTCLQKAQFI